MKKWVKIIFVANICFDCFVGGENKEGKGTQAKDTPLTSQATTKSICKETEGGYKEKEGRRRAVTAKSFKRTYY